MTKDNSIYLGHIKESILNILIFTDGFDKDAFLKDKLVQHATIRNLEIIGEAAKNLGTDYKNSNPEIHWKKMAGMRDKLIHQYMGVDLLAVWGVIEEVLPSLEKQIDDLLKNFNEI